MNAEPIVNRGYTVRDDGEILYGSRLLGEEEVDTFDNLRSPSRKRNELTRDVVRLIVVELEWASEGCGALRDGVPQDVGKEILRGQRLHNDLCGYSARKTWIGRQEAFVDGILVARSDDGHGTLVFVEHLHKRPESFGTHLVHGTGRQKVRFVDEDDALHVRQRWVPPRQAEDGRHGEDGRSSFACWHIPCHTHAHRRGRADHTHRHDGHTHATCTHERAQCMQTWTRHSKTE